MAAVAAAATSGSSSAGDESKTGPLFDDMFDVLRVNPEGKKFEKVNRLVCKGTTLDVDMIVDIASEVYNLGKDERFSLRIASTLRLDGRKDDDAFDQSGRETLLDQYDYGMCGRVFQYDIKGSKVALMVSFGGLLMKLEGERQHLAAIELDARVYALFRKAKSAA
ncbi:hypothetical protein FNF27_02549 [Cafeteria roenbergensis]|uniref:DNA-directed RNA polymerases I, II, and III subunit RPABC3 n=1 Tax=Cafeteria roenbergensis TaxID=33653 RepID=A0A5A8C6V6_CAFRO|nr:hypothetical protein FNF29_06645 [Cafeteria roenbergensis]KAA0154871.1 hypothetical protein FNF31_06212 [Cafeteria roenbergensis]KAA0160488.1 hypothetical protein FNF28_05444 [Cafeteria roenbergensis]KAA0175828.1 hypothetical protein FNF27_02549 [Cafeteria roenbergensis]|eukprot:KAA0148427.1 hypothetical protein FNF29_06645 [Cafeteria roenbergensis]